MRLRGHLVNFVALAVAIPPLAAASADPEQLTEPELNDVLRWCRCLSLIGMHRETGVDKLTDEECAFVADALQDFDPNLPEHPAYFSLYQSCLHRRVSSGR